MNLNNITLTILKMKSCGACTDFTINIYGKLKEKLFNETKVGQIENIILTKNKLDFYKNLYDLDSKAGVPLLIIEVYSNNKRQYKKYNGKREISQILNWINEFLYKKINIQNN